MTVVVSLGTDHHPFHRVLAWARAWPGAAREGVLAQTGETAPMDGLDCRDYLAPEELSAAMAEAVAVVCHGGPGTIMQARDAGHVPIVVPRLHSLGEHVDDHQARFARWLAAKDWIVLVESEGQLHDALDRAVASGRGPAAGASRSGCDDVAVVFGDLVDALARQRLR